jgi:hypothetical protein
MKHHEYARIHRRGFALQDERKLPQSLADPRCDTREPASYRTNCKV